MPDLDPALLAAFPRETDHGLLTAIALPHHDEVPGAWWDELFGEERAHAETLGKRRVPTFIGGRRALRAAASGAGSEDQGSEGWPPEAVDEVQRLRAQVAEMASKRAA